MVGYIVIHTRNFVLLIPSWNYSVVRRPSGYYSYNYVSILFFKHQFVFSISTRTWVAEGENLRTYAGVAVAEV